MREEKNVLIEEKPESLLSRFLSQLNDPLIYVLLFAGFVSAIMGEGKDTFVILFVVVFDAVIGVIQEGRAEQALVALKKLSSPRALIRENGSVREIPAARLRKGDTVILTAGRQVPADLRLTAAHQLTIEESALTGESLPVQKDIHKKSDENSPLGDRFDRAFMGTIVTGGTGEGIVTDIGMDTQIGHIAAAIRQAPRQITPLQKKLGELGETLSILALLLCGLLFALAIWQKRPILEMLLTAISLAVAAVPEGLPAIVTIVLAMSVSRLARAGTIVRRLPSVETLGAVSVICTDKTGTLTQNRMQVTHCFWNGKLRETEKLPHSCGSFLCGFLLCNNAVIEGSTRIGDATELALLDLGARFGQSKREWEKKWPRLSEVAFDSATKRMETTHRGPEGTVTFLKGAPDRLLPLCTRQEGPGGTSLPLREQERALIERAMSAASSQGLRLLALIRKEEPDAPFCFVGFVGMKDPIRPEVPAAIAHLRGAGIRTVMITGDYPDTAAAIAGELTLLPAGKPQPQTADASSVVITGNQLDEWSEAELTARLPGCQVFARVSPHHKVRIVNALKASGAVTAMTGDGVNDAPSLKAAHIGIAMGRSGTDVARSAADMVLTDDNFATIEKAVAEGRCIYENIRKSVLFLLSSNFGEIMTMFFTVLLRLPLPLLAIHILWINLITDSLPALSLGIDKMERSRYMRRPPRSPEESILAGGGRFCILLYGLLIAAVSILGFLSPALALTAERATLPALSSLLADEALLLKSQTYTFTILGMSQLFHALGMKDLGLSVFRMDHRDNPLMLLSVSVGLILQIAVTQLSLLQEIFGTCALSPEEWGYLLLLSLLPLLVHELFVPFWRFREKKSGAKSK